MASVTFSSTIGGDNSTVTDDADLSTGLKKGGATTRFVPALAQIVAIAQWLVTWVGTQITTINAAVTSAAGYASTAVNSSTTQATTTTSITPASGAIAFTLAQTGKAFGLGQWVNVASAAALSTKWLLGQITAFNSGTGAMTVTVPAGFFTGAAFTDGIVTVSAPPGQTDVPNTRNVSTIGLATGGGNLTADRTINVPAAASSDVRAGTDTTKAVTSGALMGASAFQALTDASTIAMDCNNGFNARVTLTASGHTMGAPTNLFDGLSVSIEIVQDATGSRTMSWNSIWDFGAAGLPILQTTAAKADRVFGQYNSRTGKIEASFRKGI